MLPKRKSSFTCGLWTLLPGIEHDDECRHNVIVGVTYITELFIAWYSVNEFERFAFRATGPYRWAYATMMTCNVITPQRFWSTTIRRSAVWSFVLAVVVNIGMWFERFVNIVTSLHRDYLPSSWAMFHPTRFGISDFLFTMGLFFALFLLFAKLLPVVTMAEVKAILKSSSEKVPQLTQERSQHEAAPTLPTTAKATPPGNIRRSDAG